MSHQWTSTSVARPAVEDWKAGGEGVRWPEDRKLGSAEAACGRGRGQHQPPSVARSGIESGGARVGAVNLK